MSPVGSGRAFRGVCYLMVRLWSFGDATEVGPEPVGFIKGVRSA